MASVALIYLTWIKTKTFYLFRMRDVLLGDSRSP